MDSLQDNKEGKKMIFFSCVLDSVGHALQFISSIFSSILYLTVA